MCLKMATSTCTVEQGGYSCEFVEKPPAAVQVECPVCLQILREPYLVSCCGYSFCNGCIKQVQAGNKPCPTCKEDGFSVFPNKGSQRMLNSFNVRCSSQKEGCEWTGELGQLANHLNLDPSLDRLLEGCIYSVVKCIHCSDTFRRDEIKSHQDEECPKRPYSCEYCRRYETNYEDVTKHHWSVCGSKPLQCPNNCGSSPSRQKLNDHVSNDCPLTLTSCDFPGCKLKLPRKDIPQHHQTDLLKHMSLLAKSHKELERENKELKTNQKQLEKENESFKRQILELKGSSAQQQTKVQGTNQALSQRVSGLEAKAVILTDSQQQFEGDCQSLTERVVELETKVRPLWKKVFVIGCTNSGNPFD